MRKLIVGLAVAFLLFAGLTTWDPCTFSYPNISRHVVAIVHADDPPLMCDAGQCDGGDATPPPCECNTGADPNAGECKAKWCAQTSWGCGPLWLFSCNGIGRDVGLF